MAGLLRSRLVNGTNPGITANPALSWTVSNFRAAPNQTPRQQQDKDSVKPPSFSFKDLNVSPTVKVVVYGAIAVIATAETVTYGTWAWYKIYPRDGAEPQDEM